VAAKNGYMDMVKTLLSKGADVNLGKSPLVAAIENNHSRIADFLVKNGSDRTIVIQYVLGQGNVVKLLREREIKNKK
jgi:ankyrin repeat protein